MNLLQVVVENLRLLVLAPLALGLLALGIAFTIPPSFTATTRFIPPKQQQSRGEMLLQGLGALSGLAGAPTGMKTQNDQYVALLKSETIANNLVDRFKLMQRFKAKYKIDARKNLANASRMGAGRDGIISVAVDDTDPVFAAQLANAYVEELGNLLSRLAVSEAQKQRVFFEAQLAQTKEDLVKAEITLKASGVNSTALKSSPEVSVKALAELQAQIAAQEIKLGSMRGYLSETAPDFRQAQTELAALRGQLSKVGRSSDVADTPTDADYVSRFRDYKHYETLAGLLAQQFEMAKVEESRGGGIIQVIDPALPPERHSKPRKAEIVILTMSSAVLFLLLFVFFRHSMRRWSQAPSMAGKVAKLNSAWARVIGRS